jgi:hypothetical protein
MDGRSIDCETVREDIEAYALGALEQPAVRRLERTSDLAGCRDRSAHRTVAELPLSVNLVSASAPQERVLGGVGLSGRRHACHLVRTSRWWAAPSGLSGLGIGAVVWDSYSAQVNDLKQDNAALAR